MAVLFYSNGVLCSSDTFVATPRATYFNSRKVLTIVSENSHLVNYLAELLNDPRQSAQSLLDWLPPNAVFWIQTANKIYKLSFDSLVEYPTPVWVGEHALIARLLKRLKLSDLNSLWLTALIHGNQITQCQLLTTTTNGLIKRKLVPPLRAARKHVRSLLRFIRVSKGS